MTDHQIQLDTTSLDELNGAIGVFTTSFGGELKKTVDQQTRLLARSFTDFTPPWADGRPPDGDNSNRNRPADRRVGEKQVKEHLLRTVAPASMVFKDPQYKNKQLEKYVKRQDKVRLQRAFEHMPKMKRWKVVDFSENLHTSTRKRGGRFRPTPQFKMTFDKQNLAGYLQVLRKRVGWMKAGWAIAVREFGGSVPSWITRHLGYARGTAENIVNKEDSHINKISNDTPGVGRFTSGYNIALRWRAKAITRDIIFKRDYLLRRARLK